MNNDKTLIDTLKSELVAAEDVLLNLNSSNKYKISKLLRLIQIEIFSSNYKKALTFVKKAVSYLLGNKGIFVDDLKEDPVNKVIMNISNSIGLLNLLSGFDTSIFCVKESSEKIEYNLLRINKDKKEDKKRVAYFTNMVLDWYDGRPRYGGGERYCLTLTNLLSEHGFEVDIYQLAPKKFVGEYYGYKVIAIPHGDFYSEFNIDAVNEFYNVSNEYDYVIYNAPELCTGKMRGDSISICHGIWFDHNNYPSMRYRQATWFRCLYKAFSNPNRIVSVDTNSVNVIRSLWPELAGKMRVIPNFVDHSKFYPADRTNNSKLKILFPRRSQINRGSRILEGILSQVPHDVDFYWVGEGDDADTQLIKDLCKKDHRLKFETASFDEMPNWYRMADIVVIPTIACEGTSLACIEALASGCATISTNVGGLSDIVFNGINGLLVNPDPKSIALAINELIENEEKRVLFQEEAYKFSLSFSIEKWKESWLNVLRDEKWIT